MKALRHFTIAVRAAANTPKTIRSALAPLLSLPTSDAPDRATPVAASDVNGTLSMTRRVLVLLARIPGQYWRTTCLYRSVAECLALRAVGAPALIRLGVRSSSTPQQSEIVAHAWVECPWLSPAADTAPYHLLRSSLSAGAQ
jgi:hypothetical protein